MQISDESIEVFPLMSLEPYVPDYFGVIIYEMLVPQFVRKGEIPNHRYIQPHKLLPDNIPVKFVQ